jgi:hypothetical protein
MDDVGIVRPAQDRGHHRQRQGDPEAAEAMSLTDFLWISRRTPADQQARELQVGAGRDADLRPLPGAEVEGFRFVGPTTIYAFAGDRHGQ